MGPLSGLKIIDVGTAMAGPYVSALLGDLGAEVIKVEKPRRGDLIRFTDRHIQGHSGYFLGLNRGKRGMTADLREPEGQEIIRRLVRDADVIIENYRGGKMAEWNLGYEDLAAINPRLVYCSISMFADDLSGYESLVGNDKIAQAISGLMDNTGEADGMPQRLGAPIVDAAGGFLGAIGVLAAIHRRTETGQGEHVKVSLLEAAYALMPPWIPSILNSDVEFTRHGHKHPLLAPYQLFEASDGMYLVIGAFHNESWRRLCHAIGRADLLKDPRFEDNLGRVENRDVLDPIIESEIIKEPAEHWQKVLEKESVPVAPVLSIRQSVEQFSETASQLTYTVEHDQLGQLRMLRPPIRFGDDAEEADKPTAAPMLSQDTAGILRSLGYDDDEIERLRESRIV